MLQELADLSQLYRELQLKNLYLLENVDEQVDQILDLKQHIDYLKSNLLTTRKRQLDYLSELYQLYNSKDKEIDQLAYSLHMSGKEKEAVEQRRDQAFS